MNASPQRKKPVSDLSRQPLAQLFLRKLVGGYVLLGVLIFGVQLIAEYRTHRQRLVADLHTMATTFGPGAAAKPQKPCAAAAVSATTFPVSGRVVLRSRQPPRWKLRVPKAVKVLSGSRPMVRSHPQTCRLKCP